MHLNIGTSILFKTIDGQNLLLHIQVWYFCLGLYNGISVILSNVHTLESVHSAKSFHVQQGSNLTMDTVKVLILVCGSQTKLV